MSVRCRGDWVAKILLFQTDVSLTAAEAMLLVWDQAADKAEKCWVLFLQCGQAYAHFYSLMTSCNAAEFKLRATAIWWLLFAVGRVMSLFHKNCWFKHQNFVVWWDWRPIMSICMTRCHCKERKRCGFNAQRIFLKSSGLDQWLATCAARMLLLQKLLLPWCFGLIPTPKLQELIVFPKDKLESMATMQNPNLGTRGNNTSCTCINQGLNGNGGRNEVLATQHVFWSLQKEMSGHQSSSSHAQAKQHDPCTFTKWRVKSNMPQRLFFASPPPVSLAAPNQCSQRWKTFHEVPTLFTKLWNFSKHTRRTVRQSNHLMCCAFCWFSQQKMVFWQNNTRVVNKSCIACICNTENQAHSANADSPSSISSVDNLSEKKPNEDMHVGLVKCSLSLCPVAVQVLMMNNFVSLWFTMIIDLPLVGIWSWNQCWSIWATQKENWNSQSLAEKHVHGKQREMMVSKLTFVSGSNSLQRQKWQIHHFPRNVPSRALCAKKSCHKNITRFSKIVWWNHVIKVMW